jgi:DNA-binding CsgD family transcriptional regulator/sugar lactone lactonase YvrE
MVVLIGRCPPGPFALLDVRCRLAKTRGVKGGCHRGEDACGVPDLRVALYARTVVSGLQLSRRESEVAELVRQGLSNREIAGRLFISERTVEGHVRQIHNKLGFGSRAQIAAWMAEGGKSTTPAAHPAPAAGPRSRRRRVPLRWVGMGAIALIAVAGLGVAALLLAHAPPVQVAGGQGSVASIVSGSEYGGLAIDRDGNVYISTCREVSRIMPGDSPQPFFAEGCQLGLVEVPAQGPRAIAIGPQGDLYVADQPGKRVRKITRAGIATTIAGDISGSTGDGIPALQARLVPESLAATATGDLYVAEWTGSGAGRVRRIDAGTGLISTVAGIGTPGYSGDGGPAIYAQFGGYELHIAFRNGSLYIADTDNNRIRVVDPVGTITTIVGTRTAGRGGDGRPADRASLNQPAGLAFDSHGDLYIADSSNNVIRLVHKGTITTVAGTGRAGSKIESSPLETQLSNPTDLAFDGTDSLYVNDIGNKRVLRLTFPRR